MHGRSAISDLKEGKPWMICRESWITLEQVRACAHVSVWESQRTRGRGQGWAGGGGVSCIALSCSAQREKEQDGHGARALLKALLQSPSLRNRPPRGHVRTCCIFYYTTTAKQAQQASYADGEAGDFGKMADYLKSISQHAVRISC